MLRSAALPAQRSRGERGGRAARRGRVLASLVFVGLLSSAGAAQTIGVVSTADGIDAFDQAIRGLEQSVGGSVVQESLRADAARWPKVQERVAKKSPSVWVPVGPLALSQVAKVSGNVVFMMVATPEKTLPGGTPANVAGVTLRLPPSVQFAAIRRVLPSTSRIGVLYDPSNSVSAREVKDAQGAASQLGLTLVSQPVSDTGQVGRALGDLLAKDIDLLWLLADQTVTPPGNTEIFKYLVETTAAESVPIAAYGAHYTRQGALLSVGPDFADIGAQAGDIVKRILAGTPPSAIGIEPPRKGELSVNKKVASALGIDVPEAVLKVATVFD